MEAWQLVGCGPASGCIGCPPTTEEQRLYFFTCEEVASEHGGAAAEEQMIGPLSVPRPFAGVGMVDSLMPQWDKTGGNWEIMPEDLRMVAEYEAWLPDKVFDARESPAPAHPLPTPLTLLGAQTPTSGTSPTTRRRWRPSCS